MTTIRNEMSEGNLEKSVIANLIALNALSLEYVNALSVGNEETGKLRFASSFLLFMQNIIPLLEMKIRRCVLQRLCNKKSCLCGITTIG